MDCSFLRGRRVSSVFVWLLVAVAGFASATPAVAADWYVAPSGSGSSCTLGSPCDTVAAAIANAGSGDTIHIASGTYPNSGPALTVSVDGLTLIGEGTTQPQLSNTTGTVNHPLLVIDGAQNVTVKNLQFDMDQSFVAEGILAAGNVDGLNISSNHFVGSRTVTTPTQQNSKDTWRNAININDSANSMGLSRVNGSNVTVTGNTIDGNVDGTNGVFMRSGIDMDGGTGTISGNTITAGVHDIRVRSSSSASHKPTLIDGNTLNGRGLELDTPNVTAGAITIGNNHINAIAGIDDSTPYPADWSIMRLIGNPQNVPVIVSGNTFAGYQGSYRGVLVENFPATTFTGNTFSPAPNAIDFASLVVSNKALFSGAPLAPYTMAITAQGNIFNGSGLVDGNGDSVAAGTDVEFLNDNDAGATFGALQFGGAGANEANSFNGNPQFYFYLGNYNCETVNAPMCSFLDYAGDIGSNPDTNTNVRPFPADVQASHNVYDGAMPEYMSVNQLDALNMRTLDKNTHAALGTVIYAAPPPPMDVYVNKAYAGAANGDSETFTHPQVNGGTSINVTFGQNAFATITDGLAHVADGGNVYVTKGVYAETDGYGDNLEIDRPVHIIGQQAGVDARTRNVADADETIVVPADAEAGLTLDSYYVPVIYVDSSDVTIDGLVVDADNTALSSGIDLNGADPDVAGGIYVEDSGNVTLQNLLVRNMIYAGIDGYTYSAATGGNIIRDNRFTNITAPSLWGRGVILENNFYAQVTDNLMDEVRVGIQTNNNRVAAPNGFVPAISNNEIHATRTGIFHNEFTGAASPYTIANNAIIAAAHAGETSEWSGVWVETMLQAQTATISGNVIDGSAVTGTQPSVGYLLNNITSSASASTVIDGGSVSGVDAGVQATDATSYAGPVNDMLVQNVAFSDIGTGAFYVEDTNEQSGSAKLTIGDGNTYANVAHVLALSGSAPVVAFAGSQTGVPSVLVRSGRGYFDDPPSMTYTVANAAINTGIGYASSGGTVSVEAGTFAQNVLVDKDVTLAGPNVGVAGNSTSRQAEATVVGTLRIESPGVSVDGMRFGDETVSKLLTHNNNSQGFVFTNSIVDNLDGTFVQVSNPHDWTFKNNLLRNITGYALRLQGGVQENTLIEGNEFDNVHMAAQIIGNVGTRVINNTIDSIATGGDFAIQVANSSDVAVTGNTIRSAKYGLQLDHNDANLVLSCNDVEASTYALQVADYITPGSDAMHIFDNRFVASTQIQTKWQTGQTLTIGSNFFDGASITPDAPNGATVQLADALPVNPIGNAACGDNTATQTVVYTGSNQHTPINAAFADPLQARVVDALGGAVMGEPVTFTPPSSGASATLGSVSGTTDYNGVFASTAMANASAGTYGVIAADTAGGGVAPVNFTLTNDLAAGTVAWGTLTFTEDGSGHAVTAHIAQEPATACTVNPSSVGPGVGSYAVSATCNGINYTASGSAVATITAAPKTDLAVSITDNREYAQYGHALSYVIVVSNVGNQDVTGATVDDTLPVTLLAQQPYSWHCYPGANASCASAHGSGNLNTSVDIQAGGSVTFVLDTLVNPAPNQPTDDLFNSVTVAAAGDTNGANNNATDTTVAVIFRDGFEQSGDGAQVPQFVGTLHAASTGSATNSSLIIPLSTPTPNRVVTTLVCGSDGHGQALRVEALRIGGALLVRVVTRGQHVERASHWVAVRHGTAALGMGLVKAAHGATHVLLVGANAPIEVPLPSAVLSTHVVKAQPAKG